MWPLYLVMTGLGPVTHEGVCGFKWKNSWVAGPSPAMTDKAGTLLTQMRLRGM
jgi:hypothetical protein